MTTTNCITPPVFTPTWEEFADFQKYIESIEEVAAPYGVCKIIPPQGWKPNEKYLGREHEIDFPIQTAITQHTTGAKGVYLQMHEELENLPIRFMKFKKIILEPPKLDKELEEQSTPSQELEFIERKYWKNILFQPAVYASDIPGSLFDANICQTWNLQNLNSVLQKQFKKHNVCIPGVNSPFLYVGSFKSTFCWHTEDMELYSINYLHFGAPKTWYSIPLSHKKKFEDLARRLYPDEFKKCSQAPRHKNMLISPSILATNGVKVTRITQQVGEFMITFPGGYHAGFNHGLNCAEATNFATSRWIEIGKHAQRCTCESGTVNIDVDTVFGNLDEEGATQGPIDFDTYLGDFQIDFVKASPGTPTIIVKEPVQPKKRKSRAKTPQEPLAQDSSQVQKLPTLKISLAALRQHAAQPLVQTSVVSVSSVPVVETIQVAQAEQETVATPENVFIEAAKTDAMDMQNDTPTKKTPDKKSKKKSQKKKATPDKIEKQTKQVEKKKHHPLFAKFYAGSFNQFAKFK